MSSASTADPEPSCSNPVGNIIADRLIPFFNRAGDDEPAARRVTLEAMAAYHPETGADYLSAGRILALSLAMIDTAGRLNAELPATLRARLLAAVRNLNRAAEQAERTMTQRRRLPVASSHAKAGGPDPSVAPQPEAAPSPDPALDNAIAVLVEDTMTLLEDSHAAACPDTVAASGNAPGAGHPAGPDASQAAAAAAPAENVPGIGSARAATEDAKPHAVAANGAASQTRGRADPEATPRGIQAPETQSPETQAPEIPSPETQVLGTAPPPRRAPAPADTPPEAGTPLPLPALAPVAPAGASGPGAGPAPLNTIEPAPDPAAEASWRPTTATRVPEPRHPEQHPSGDPPASMKRNHARRSTLPHGDAGAGAQPPG